MVKKSSIGQGKGGGRPPSITPEKSAILFAALENGFSLSESLAQAGISDDAYRRLLEKSEKFRGEITAAKMKLVMLARSKVALSINAGDMPTVRWFLERKVPEEYGRQATLNDGLPQAREFITILPGNKPHPRLTLDPIANPNVRYAFDTD
jgi:hypothetical protein